MLTLKNTRRWRVTSGDRPGRRGRRCHVRSYNVRESPIYRLFSIASETDASRGVHPSRKPPSRASSLFGYRRALLHILYLGILSKITMAHTIQDKRKLLARLGRIRGQINAIEKALNEERDCGDVLLTLAACRGAMNALMAEILEGHVRLHLLPSGAARGADRMEAAEELIEVIKRYLK
jgi:DNA-binding FrmR family transcriptional regulator